MRPGDLVETPWGQAVYDSSVRFKRFVFGRPQVAVYVYVRYQDDRKHIWPAQHVTPLKRSDG